MGHKTPLGASPSVALRAGATPLGPCAPGLAPPFGLHAHVPSYPQGLLRPGLKRPGLKRPLRLKCLFGTGSNARPSSLVCPGGQWWRRLRVRPLNWGGHHFFFFKAGEPLRLLAGTRTWLLAKLTTNKKNKNPNLCHFLKNGSFLAASSISMQLATLPFAEPSSRSWGSTHDGSGPRKTHPTFFENKMVSAPGGFSASSWQAFFQAAFGFMPPPLRLHAASPSAGRLLTLVAALPVKKEGEGVRREQGAWNAMCRELGTEEWSGSPKPKLWLPEKKNFMHSHV